MLKFSCQRAVTFITRSTNSLAFIINILIALNNSMEHSYIIQLVMQIFKK